jgi:transcriptional antiterminator RfaH
MRTRAERISGGSSTSFHASGAELAPRWYVVRTKPHNEKRVHHNLGQMGVETLCPMLFEHYVSRGGEGASRIIPLFPGYIFGRFSAVQQWHSVRFTRGVREVLCAEGRPVPIDDEVVRIVESKVASDGLVRPVDVIQPGERVVIRGGPFDGLIGILESPTHHETRLTVLLTLVNWSARVEIARAHVYRT